MGDDGVCGVLAEYLVREHKAWREHTPKPDLGVDYGDLLYYSANAVNEIAGLLGMKVF